VVFEGGFAVCAAQLGFAGGGRDAEELVEVVGGVDVLFQIIVGHREGGGGGVREAPHEGGTCIEVDLRSSKT
jgi:hypothetical protein